MKVNGNADAPSAYILKLLLYYKHFSASRCIQHICSCVDRRNSNQFVQTPDIFLLSVLVRPEPRKKNLLEIKPTRIAYTVINRPAVPLCPQYFVKQNKERIIQRSMYNVNTKYKQATFSHYFYSKTIVCGQNLRP